MNPERDSWPSVEDEPEKDLCPWCECMPDERHGPTCPLYAPAFDDLLFCDRCGVTYTSSCACDDGDDR